MLHLGLERRAVNEVQHIGAGTSDWFGTEKVRKWLVGLVDQLALVIAWFGGLVIAGRACFAIFKLALMAREVLRLERDPSALAALCPHVNRGLEWTMFPAIPSRRFFSGLSFGEVMVVMAVSEVGVIETYDRDTGEWRAWGIRGEDRVMIQPIYRGVSYIQKQNARVGVAVHKSRRHLFREPRRMGRGE